MEKRKEKEVYKKEKEEDRKEEVEDKNLSISPASLSVPGVPQSLRRPAALLANTQLPQP